MKGGVRWVCDHETRRHCSSIRYSFSISSMREQIAYYPPVVATCIHTCAAVYTSQLTLRVYIKTILKRTESIFFKQNIRDHGYHPRRKGSAFGGRWGERKHRRSLPSLRNGGYPRGTGPRAVEEQGGSASHLSLHHLQTGHARETGEWEAIVYVTVESLISYSLIICVSGALHVYTCCFGSSAGRAFCQ